MSLLALRFDRSTYETPDAKPAWRKVRLDDVRAFLSGEPGGPAAYLLEESMLERLLLAANPDGAEPLIEDFGRQGFNKKSNQTTRLQQVFMSARGHAAVQSVYRATGKICGNIAAFVDGMLAQSDPPRHLRFVGVTSDIWDYLVEGGVGDGKIEPPIWATLRQEFRGSSSLAERVRRLAFEAGQSKLPTLVLGETGTGKGVFARCLHLVGRSRGRAHAWESVNCAALAPTVEAVLFGWERGAFTGADRATPGLFERANGGTLFLDEIGLLTLAEQAKLLKVIEDREVQRMGSTRWLRVDVKIVTATNEDLAARVEQGTFRADLFERLRGMKIRLPALRDRREDIPDLVEAFWPGSVTHGKLPDAVLDLLMQQEWPGNVRQLQNVVLLMADLAAAGRPVHRDLALEILADDVVGAQVPVVPTEAAAPASGTIAARLDAYEAERPRYERLGHGLATIVGYVIRERALLARVESQTATRQEVADRLHRGEPGVAIDPSSFSRVTVSVYAPNGKRDLYLALRSYLDLRGDVYPQPDEELSSARLRPLVYTARIDERSVQRLSEIGLMVPADLRGLSAVLELRTMIEDQAHAVREEVDVVGGKMPRHLERKILELEGLLREAQRQSLAIHHDLRHFAGSYGNYISDEEARRQLACDRMTLAVAPGVKVAVRASKLAIVLGDWEQAIEILAPYAKSKNARVLRDLGAALCKLHAPGSEGYQKGLDHLEEACRLAPHDPDAFARRAGALRRMGEIDAARAAYERALAVDPGSPYALSGLLHTTLMLERDSDVIARMKDEIEAAVGRCRDRVAASLDMPWALLDLGKFLLLSGQVREGLEAYAKAIGRTTAPWMLQTTARSLAEFSSFPSVPRTFFVAFRMVVVGWCARFRTEEGARRLALFAKKRRDLGGQVVMLVDVADTPPVEGEPALASLIVEGLAGFQGRILVAGRAGGTPSMLADRLRQTISDPARVLDYRPRPMRGIENAVGKALRESGPTLGAWADLVASNVPAGNVTVLLLGEGRRGGVERELATALGARAAVVRVAEEEDGDVPWDEEEFGTLRVLHDAASLAELVATPV